MPTPDHEQHLASRDCRHTDYAMEPWHRRTGDEMGQFRIAHAWCLPTKYVAAGWVKGSAAEIFDVGVHDCDLCGNGMEDYPR